MGLDNYPDPYPCKKLGVVVFTEQEHVDCDRTVYCPFKHDDTPTGPFGTSCWYRGRILARELDAIGMDELAAACYQDMSCSAVSEFADQLNQLADSLEDRVDDLRGAGWNGIFEESTGHIKWQEYSNKSDVISAIRTGAAWYKKVAGFGCGVRAWY